MSTVSKFSIACSVILISLFFVGMIDAGDPVEVEDLSWSKADPPVLPGVRICGLMVYDIQSDVVLLYGGFDNVRGSPELWAYDYETDTWTNMTPANSPPGRLGQGFIYDEGRDICLMFFGIDGMKYYNDTWEYDYDTNTWTQLFPDVNPSPRCKGGSAYDIESDQVVFFGGYGPDEINLAETWTYNYDENTWVNMTTDTAPPARKRNPAIYDVDDDRVVMFGGWIGGNEVLGDTWTYDFNTNTWTNKDPSVAPQGRARYGRVYLPETGNVMISHGFSGVPDESPVDLNDTWEYDLQENEWIQVDIQGETMEKRHCFQMALDEQSGVIIAQGGSYKNSYVDTWILDPYEAKEDDGSSSSGVIIIVLLIILAITIVAIVIYRGSKDE